MSKSFKGEYITFYVRLAKRLAPLGLLLLFALYKIFFSRRFSVTFADYKVHFLIILAIAVSIGIYYHTNKIRTVVNEIILTEQYLYIHGHDFSAKYEDKLDINKVLIEIQEEELGKNKIRYCIEIYVDDKYYYLNKFNDWNYETLAAIADEFKAITGKKVSGFQYYAALKNGNQ